MPTQTVSASVDIAVPTAKVYAYVADLPRHVEWNHQPRAMTSLTDGPLRVGSRFETVEVAPSHMRLREKVMFALAMPLILRYLGSPGRTIAEVTALEADRRVAWQAHMPSRRKGDLMRMSWSIELTPVEHGTRVVQHGVAAPPDNSPFAGMVNADMAATMQREVASNLVRLKGVLESRPWADD